MSVSYRCLVGILFVLFGASIVIGQEKARPGVELYWVESTPVDGLTEIEGFQSSCDPDDLVYPHKKPAIVLDGDSARVDINELEIGGTKYFMVTLVPNRQARAKLAASLEGKGDQMRLLTANVNGQFRSVQRYEIDRRKNFVPESAKANSFTFNLGMFLKMEEVRKVEEALATPVPIDN